MKASQILRKAAKKFDSSAQDFVKKLAAFKNGRVQSYSYPEPAIGGCCDAIDLAADDLDSLEIADYFLRFFHPLHHPNAYWWTSPESPETWGQDINARVLALLFAAEIAESIGD